MGHKVHPTGFRLGVVKGWQSRWYAERDYKDIVAEDFLVRQMIKKELANAAVSEIEIERAAANQMLVKIHTAKPGIVIGKSGEKVDRLKVTLEKKTKKRVRLEVVEIRHPELDAHLVGRAIAEQLERRISFRRAMKQAVQKSMRANAKGVKVIVGGRLGGTEIARTEKEVEGKVPLHTLRADIDYALAEAHTTFGVIGIKVWIYRGDILPSKRRKSDETLQEFAEPLSSASSESEGRERRHSTEGGSPRGERSPSRPPSRERTQSRGRGNHQTDAGTARGPARPPVAQSGERSSEHSPRRSRPAEATQTRSSRSTRAERTPVNQSQPSTEGASLPTQDANTVGTTENE